MEIKMIPIGELHPSPTNPRKHFNEEKLKELSASIADEGVLEPILARPQPLEGTGFEIVAGERRWRASRMAGLSEVPCIVRKMSDDRVVDIQLIENLQREDLTPMDEAFGYKEALELRDVNGNPRHTISSLALKLGRPRSTISQRLLICNLPDVAAKAVETGMLPPRTAELIGRIPSEALRKKATQAILKPRFQDEPLSYRKAKEMIEEDLMANLAAAPWKLDDAELLPEAGPCSTCPHRSANCPDLFEAKEAEKFPNICLDVECHGRKMDADFHRRAAQAEQAGAKVLSAAEAKRIFPYGSDHMDYDSPYVELSSTPRHADTEKDCKKSWKTLTKKQDVPIVLVRTPSGKTLELVERKLAITAAIQNGHNIFTKDIAKKAGVGKDAAKDLPEDPSKVRAREEREKAQIETETKRRQMTAIIDRIITKGLSETFWEAFGLMAIQFHMNADSARFMVQRLDIECPQNSWGSELDHREGIRQWFEKQTGDLALPAVLEILLSGPCQFASLDRKDCAWNHITELFSEQVSGLRKEVETEHKEAKKAKGAKAKKKPAKSDRAALADLAKGALENLNEDERLNPEKAAPAKKKPARKPAEKKSELGALTPQAKMLGVKYGLAIESLEALPGTSPDGRVQRTDVEAALASGILKPTVFIDSQATMGSHDMASSTIGLGVLVVAACKDDVFLARSERIDGALEFHCVDGGNLELVDVKQWRYPSEKEIKSARVRFPKAFEGWDTMQQANQEAAKRCTGTLAPVPSGRQPSTASAS